MLKKMKSLKNNSSGYVMVYIILLVAFITVIFAGTSMALNSRTSITSRTLSNKQLQVTAQSALGTIVDEFENNAELKAKLKDYAESSQSANFALTEETGVSDNINVKITKEPGEESKARITVTASNESGSISTAFALVDYDTPPKGESAGVVDNLIVAFVPDGVPNGSRLLVGNNDSLNERSLEGKVIVNNYNKDTIVLRNGNYIESILASGDILCENGTIKAVDENIDGKIASTNGTVTMNNQAVIKGKGINLIAAKGGYNQKTDNFVWENDEVQIITGDKGDVDIQALQGTIGSIISGGNINIIAKDTGDLTIDGDVMGTKNITWSERGPGLKTTVNGDIVSGEHIQANLQRSMVVNGDIAAVGKIVGQGGGGNDAMQLTADNIYAGREVNLTNLGKLVTGSILSGANYRNSDGASSKEKYNNFISRGGVTLRGTTPTIYGNIIINDKNGACDIQGYDKNSDKIYQRDAADKKNDAFNSVFYSANSNWRSLMLKVEKGADSAGYINLAVALNPDEINIANRLGFNDFTTAMTPEYAYYENCEGTAVSHHSGYTVDERKHILNSTIKDTFNTLNDEYSNSIPDENILPTIKIPSAASSTYATVRMDGSDLTVVEGGYMQVGGNPYSNDCFIKAVDANDGNVKIMKLWSGANICFDTTNKKSYDIVIGAEDMGISAASGSTAIFPWNICVNQPEENMGFVRFFVEENTNLQLFRGAVKNTAGSCIPEVYFFSNGRNIIEAFEYKLTGFIIIPHGLADLFRTENDYTTNKAFEGLIICGNVNMPRMEGGKRLVYYKPLTYLEAITTDIYTYEGA